MRRLLSPHNVLDIVHMSETVLVIKVYESFVLGKCGCHDHEDISIRNTMGVISRFKKGHRIKGKLNPNYGISKIGKDSLSWKGGRYKTTNGYWYIWCPNHPFCNAQGYVLEHRLVMEQHLGRYLTKEEVVHHIIPVTRDYCNNDISNLELFDTNGNHLSKTMKKNDNIICSDPKCKTPTKIKYNFRGHRLCFRDGKGGWLCYNCYQRKMYKIRHKKVK